MIQPIVLAVPWEAVVAFVAALAALQGLAFTLGVRVGRGRGRT